MPDGEHDLIRAMVVLSIKDFQKKKLSDDKLESICALCGYFIDAKKLSNSLLKWNTRASIL